MNAKRRLLLVLVVILAAAALFPMAPRASAQSLVWYGAFWPNRDFEGDPVLTGQYSQVAFDWGLGGPIAGLTNHFSAGFETQAYFAGGTVRFSARSDDGVVVLLDGEPVINAWYNHPAQQISQDVYVPAGTHEVSVLYFETTDRAQLYVWWEQPRQQPQTSAWTAEYWTNPYLSGPPAITGTVPEVNFDWLGGSPVGLPNDNFSARFSRSLYLDRGNYRFYALADDGVRVWLDGSLIIDAWHTHGATIFPSNAISLGAGQHTIRVEYFEATKEALLRFWWER